MIVWSLEDDESLVGVAFIDVQIYVTSMSSIKNFILLGDAQKSIWFLGFQVKEKEEMGYFLILMYIFFVA